MQCQITKYCAHFNLKYPMGKYVWLGLFKGLEEVGKFSLKDTWMESASDLCRKMWVHKYMSITFLVLLTVFAAAKIMLLKVSLSWYISGVIFPALSQNTAVFSWLPLHFFTFHICSEHMSRLSLRAFPDTQHRHILKMHKSYILLLSFDQSFQLVTCSHKYKTVVYNRGTKILDYN